MLKNILISCAELAGRNDISSALLPADDVEDIENADTKYDVIKLVSFFNFTMETLCERFFDIVTQEELATDVHAKIYYYNFSYQPIKILNVFDENMKPLHYLKTPTAIILQQKRDKTIVEYKYLPNPLKNLTDEVVLPAGLTKRILCYGIVSEFFASKNLFEESEFWQDKFIYEIYKRKLQKERRVKSTFCK